MDTFTLVVSGVVTGVVAACFWIVWRMPEHKAPPTDEEVRKAAQEAVDGLHPYQRELAKKAADHFAEGGYAKDSRYAQVMNRKAGRIGAVGPASFADVAKRAAAEGEKLAGLLSKDTDALTPFQAAHDLALSRQPKPPVSVGNDERMYAESGHQVVNPAVMKQVLNDHFGELNPEPTQWDGDMVAMLVMNAGVRTLRTDGDKVYVEADACKAIADRLNSLTP